MPTALAAAPSPAAPPQLSTPAALAALAPGIHLPTRTEKPAEWLWSAPRSTALVIAMLGRGYLFLSTIPAFRALAAAFASLRACFACLFASLNAFRSLLN